MLLLFTLGFLFLSLLGFRKVVFPDLKKVVEAREKFLVDAADPDFMKILGFIALVVFLLFIGIQSIYLGFAINFLLAKGVLLAKATAFVGVGLFFWSIGSGSLVIKNLFKSMTDVNAFRDVLFALPTFGKQLLGFLINVLWIGLYTIVAYFIIQ
jgi:hypothetical protein